MKTNNPITYILAFAFLSIFSSHPVLAEDSPADTCSSAASLFKEGDIEGALEEAQWCVTQLEQLKQGQTSTFFKDEINGFKGGKLNQQQTMGISMTERSYSKDGKVIQVSLSGGSSSTANNAFAAIASFGMQAAQGKKVRIQRRTAVVNDDGGNVNIIVTLKSGGMLTFDTSDLTSDEAVAFVKAFPVADLDDSRK